MGRTFPRSGQGPHPGQHHTGSEPHIIPAIDSISLSSLMMRPTGVAKRRRIPRRRIAADLECWRGLTFKSLVYGTATPYFVFKFHTGTYVSCRPQALASLVCVSFARMHALLSVRSIPHNIGGKSEPAAGHGAPGLRPSLARPTTILFKPEVGRMSLGGGGSGQAQTVFDRGQRRLRTIPVPLLPFS